LYVFSLHTTVIGVFHAYSGFMSEIAENVYVRIHGTPKHQQYILAYLLLLYMYYLPTVNHTNQDKCR